MKITQSQILQNHLDGISKKISEIKDEINAVEKNVNSKDISKLLKIKSIVGKYRNLPQKLVTCLPRFEPEKIEGKNLVKLFGTLSLSSLTADEHGYSFKTTEKSPDAGSSPSIKQLLDEPEIVTTIDIDTGYRHLHNVACMSDEEIWTSGDDSNMKLFSINQGSPLKSITTTSMKAPDDIAVTLSGDLIYTDYHDRTVNIVKNKKIQKVIRLLKWKPRSACSTSSGDLLVIMENDDYVQTKVVRYSGFNQKQIIKFDGEGKPLFSSGPFCRNITENRNLDICVSDYRAEAVVVVNHAGKLRFRYTGHTPAPNNQPFSPRGITTDSQSHILTADYNNECVHIIDQDGQFLRFIVCGLSYPQGLCTDTNDNLFVAEWRNMQVKKIKYLQ
ncbi:uncharacterized protein LOC134242172 [Saccostrea cucullata]|uniref:uncharacterized protein LOC134242172 n=1 Tax=Saccostrea cuccullata TaxID=36930 RepID=UPI002ED1DC37